MPAAGPWVPSERSDAQRWQAAIGRVPTPRLSARAPRCEAVVKPNLLAARERYLPSLCQLSDIVMILPSLFLRRHGALVLACLFQVGKVFVSFIILETDENN